MPLKPEDLRVGRTYRAKKPACSSGLYNDRTVIWVSASQVQYDGPGVAIGRRPPVVTKSAFLAWADRDVTDELPPEEYQSWPR